MSNLQLTDREWKEFAIKELFYTFIGNKGLQTPTGSYVGKDDLLSSDIPRITVRDTNNGIDSFSYSYHKNFREFENIISVSFLGSVFYHPYKVSLDMKVHALTPINVNLNKYNARFLTISLKNCITLLSYGNQLSSTDLPKVNILLPINNQGELDWQFMEDYIKQVEQKKVKEIIGYYQTKLLSNQLDYQPKDDNKQWDNFKTGDFFQFMRGNQNNMAQCEKGNIPLISAKKIDNGYKDFIANNGKKLFPQHIITLNNDGDGGVGLAYYQPTQTALDTHVTALLPKIDLTKNIMLYISLMISIQREKFSHGYSINNERLTAQQIMLPIDGNQQPDWQYMEDFIKNIEQNKIKTLLQYLNEYHLTATSDQRPATSDQRPATSDQRRSMGRI